LTADLEVRPDDSRFALRRHMLAAFRSYGIAPAAEGAAKGGIWQRAPEDLDYDRVRFESMQSDRDEVFRFLWENRRPLRLRPDAYSRVLSVRPCVRVGLDGFVLHETVAQYYQVARLTPSELSGRGIRAPKGYLEELAEQAALRRRKRDADEDEREEDDSEAATTPLYGGGVLIFDVYGRLKYHVHNDVFGRRQSRRLKYLWESGQLTAREAGARLQIGRLSRIHRARSLDARRFSGQGW
jgi:hypothetical protein